MKKLVEKIINNCRICKHHENPRRIEHPAIALTVSNLNDRVHIDFIFGFPETKDGFKGVITFKGSMAKQVLARAVKTKTASETAENLLLWISIYGPPKVILTDLGSEFNNKIIESLCKGMGVDHRVTSAYHPRANGLIENFNKTFVKSLRKIAFENKDDWPKFIPYTCLAYNSRVNSITKFSPHELCFG